MRRSSFSTFSLVSWVAFSLSGCGSDEPERVPGAGGSSAGSAGSGGAAAGSAGSNTGGSAGTASAGAAGVAGAGGTGASPDAGGVSLNVPFALTGIVGTGQSLAVGAQATAPPNATPSYNNLKLDLGGLTVPPFDPDAGALSLVPLSEPIRPYATGYPRAYPENLYGESHHTAMAAQITTLVRAAGAEDYATVHTVVGESGQGMNVINKTAVETVMGAQTTGRAYAATLFEAAAIERLAEADGKSFGIGAIFLTHGETDSGNGNYANDIVQLWTDYNADLAAITGQTQSIPLFVSQQHAFGFTAGARSPASTGMLAQWRVGLDRPGDIICTGPKYQYPYFTDNLHLVNRGYLLMGEKYGQIYFETVVLGRPWQPLQPTSVEREGAVITVRFHVPVPPLTWDTQLPEPHQTALTEWAEGKGFEVRAGGTDLTIQSVEIVEPDTVRITTTADVPAGATLGYAATSDGVALPGVSVRWGLLKDSDPFVGAVTGEAQANYAVSFELPIP